MAGITRESILRKLLLQRHKSSRLWAALLALCIGTTLLLLSVMIWWNFSELLSGHGDNDSLGSTFLTISKRVTDDKMGKPELTIFGLGDIAALRTAPQVQDVGVLTSSRFHVYATISVSMGFGTDMFLEAAPDRFIDKIPSGWQWHQGDNDVPIIISNEFLSLYNYGFAMSAGLPQLSASSIQSLTFTLKVGEGDRQDRYRAHVVGFSDRIASVLVPDSFIAYGNRYYGMGAISMPTRLIVKARDPSDKQFVSYLQQHDYTTNAEQLRWNKLRSVVTVVTAATGILSILLLSIGALVFILFIELTIARAQQSITLLLQLGYAPRYLSSFMVKRFFPMLLGTVMVAGIVASGVQYIAAIKSRSLNLSLPHLPGWPVWAALAISTLLLFILVARAIARAIR
ncbi:MAG: hypothetical protein H0X33_02950 [Taibaiella sp.]|nr:hypothetical protein [Taibaiella sp.]